MALVQSLKAQDLTTFGDFADYFICCVKTYFHSSQRVDVVFDRYMKHSIKSGTRKKRTGSKQTIRRIIQNRDVKLPTNWKGFLGLSENKADLARFLSDELSNIEIEEDTELVVSGGFADIKTVYASKI